METDVHFQSLNQYIFGATSKGAPRPPGFPHRAPSEKYAPFLEPSFSHLSTSPVYEPPSGFHSGAPIEMPLPRAFSTYLPGFPVIKYPLQVPLTELPQTETLSPYSPLHPSLKVPGKSAPFQVPHWGPYGDTRVQTLFYISFRVLSKGTPSRSPSQSAHREGCSVSIALQLSFRDPGERNPMILNGTSV